MTVTLGFGMSIAMAFLLLLSSFELTGIHGGRLIWADSRVMTLHCNEAIISVLTATGDAHASCQVQCLYSSRASPIVPPRPILVLQSTLGLL